MTAPGLLRLRYVPTPGAMPGVGAWTATDADGRVVWEVETSQRAVLELAGHDFAGWASGDNRASLWRRKNDRLAGPTMLTVGCLLAILCGALWAALLLWIGV
jgi:hypothetical protein